MRFPFSSITRKKERKGKRERGRKEAGKEREGWTDVYSVFMPA